MTDVASYMLESPSGRDIMGFRASPSPPQKPRGPSPHMLRQAAGMSLRQLPVALGGPPLQKPEAKPAEGVGEGEEEEEEEDEEDVAEEEREEWTAGHSGDLDRGESPYMSKSYRASVRNFAASPPLASSPSARALAASPTAAGAAAYGAGSAKASSAREPELSPRSSRGTAV